MMSNYRQKALREKGKSCDVCGSSQNIEVHHIDGDTSNNSIENLVPLCREHHNAVHRGDEEVQHLVEELSISGEYARFSVRMPSELDALLRERAMHESKSAIVRKSVENTLYETGQSRNSSDGVDESTLKAKIERLENEVEFLRDVVEKSIE